MIEGNPDIRLPTRRTLLQRDVSALPSPSAPPFGLLVWFLICQTILPALFFLPGTQSLRAPIRMLPYALGLMGLLFIRSRGKLRHRAEPWLIGCILYLSLMILH